jgi:hypothetical protein
MITNDRTPSRRTRRTNGLAIAALVCGIVQFSGLFPAGIVAIILGHMAQRQIRQTEEDGYGLAKAGLILGYIGITLAIVGLVVALLVGLTSTPVPIGR